MAWRLSLTPVHRGRQRPISEAELNWLCLSLQKRGIKHLSALEAGCCLVDLDAGT